MTACPVSRTFMPAARSTPFFAAEAALSIPLFTLFLTSSMAFSSFENGRYLRVPTEEESQLSCQQSAKSDSRVAGVNRGGRFVAFLGDAVAGDVPGPHALGHAHHGFRVIPVHRHVEDNSAVRDILHVLMPHLRGQIVVNGLDKPAEGMFSLMEQFLAGLALDHLDEGNAEFLPALGGGRH